MEVLTSSQVSRPVENSSSSSFLVQSGGFSASVKDRMEQKKDECLDLEVCKFGF